MTCWHEYALLKFDIKLYTVIEVREYSHNTKMGPYVLYLSKSCTSAVINIFKC